MKERTLYPIWGFLYILCVFLGAIAERSVAGRVALTALSILFFVPGAMLLYKAFQKDDKKAVKRIRILCLVSLIATMIALTVNLLVMPAGSETARAVSDLFLMAVSAPMLCCEYWFLSLFLWACLLMVTFPKLWRTTKK